MSLIERLAWPIFFISLALVIAYEVRSLAVGRKDPSRVARAAHARMRVSWVTALSQQPGFEIVAVQALRNSLMSATISASTAALALMATVSLAGQSVSSSLAQLGSSGPLSLRAVLEGMLMALLFASYLCSAMAMRFYNHAGFVMSMPAAAPERQPFNPMAADYVERAGLLYSWGLRSFLMIAPLVAGIVNPLAMLPMAMALVLVLYFFDRPGPVERAVEADDVSVADKQAD